MAETDSELSNMQMVATKAVLDSLHRLLELEENADLRDLVVAEEFASQLVAIAWAHQFDIDMARFRRELKVYIEQLSASAVSES